MSDSKKPAMAHTVFFWVKKGTSQEDLLDFEKGLTKLGQAPSLLRYHWGKPASTEDRSVTDHSFNYAINALFASIEDHNAYQEDSIHDEFIKNHNMIWDRVKVYDNATN